MSFEYNLTYCANYAIYRFGIETADKKILPTDSSRHIRSLNNVPYFLRRFLPIAPRGHAVGLEVSREFNLNGNHKNVVIVLVSTEADDVTSTSDARVQHVETIDVDATSVPAGSKIRVNFQFGENTIRFYAATSDGRLLASSREIKINL